MSTAKIARTGGNAIALHALLAGLALALTTPAFADKPKMLVQDLMPQGVEAHEAAAISTATCHAISRAERYELLCGDDLRNLMRFGALASSFEFCQDADCYADLGKAMKARFIVSGSVSRLGKAFVLALSMFDTEAGRPVGRAEVKAESLERLHAQAREAASELLSSR